MSNQRFEDWEEVDCNDCTHYWDNSCDGVTKDIKRPCNSFLASRKVTIPGEIKKLKSQQKTMLVVQFLTLLAILLYFIEELFV